MKERFITGIILAVLVGVVFLTKIVINSTIIFDLFLAMIVIIAAMEFASILKKGNRPSFKYVITLYPIIVYGILFLTIKLELSVVISLLILIGSLIIVTFGTFLFSVIARKYTEREMRVRKIYTSNTSFALTKALNTLIGLIYPTLLLSILFVLNHVKDFGYIFADASTVLSYVSVIALFAAFIIPAICDTFAYLTGTVFGGKKLAPTISEKKTISGAIGGVVWTSLILVVLYLIFSSGTGLMNVFIELNITWWHILILGILGSIACTLGDLLESYFKRKANVKDSSDLLPGHGGVLDRVDGMMLSNVVVFVFFLIFLI